MAEPKTQYEYGSAPEDEQGGIWPLLSQSGGLSTPERREVVTPSTTTYTDGEGSEEVSQESYMEALASGRPLADGDRRVNPDGSHSTELSISWPEKDGSWVLAPSLWRTPSGLVELPEEWARNVARAYEERESMRFPRFKNQEEMSEFARERSAGGGATHTPLATPIPRPRPNATRPGVEYKAAGGFMAEPKTQYEYGRTPEQTEGGLLGLFDMIRGPVADAFTPERREVITPSQTTYQEMDGYAYPTTTPGVYGPAERNLEYMPVVQGARSAADFAGKFFSDGKFREQTGLALSKGIGQMFSDYTQSASQGGETTYDPVAKREVKLDPLLPLGLGMAASMVAPVKGSGAVLGMFAGRNAATADLDALKVAQKMETKGNSRDEIWDQTGWFRYNDREGKPMGEWKFEVPDDASIAVTDPAALKPYLTETGRVKKGSGQTGYGPEIDKLLVHDELYKTYPGKTLEPVINFLENITQQRAALKEELVALKKRGLGKEELEAETKRLEALDGDIIRELINSIPTSAVPGGPAKTVREQYPLLDRPIGDTVMKSTTTGGRNLYGYFNPETNTMAVRRDMGNSDYLRTQAFRSTALHELQHAIQSREGFETGGMRQEFGRGFKNRPIDPKTGKQLTPWETYRALVGETEARLVQDRRWMDLGQRRFIPPYSQVDESMMYTRKDLGVDRGDSFSSNSPPTSKMPKLKIDNPGGKWLEGKLEQAADDRRTGRGGPSGPANITGYFEKELSLPPGLLKDIPGELGEEAHRNTSSKLAALKKSISEEGYKPAPILIHVREDGKPFIIEGNHRIVEALQSGRDTIPVELRYLRGGESADGLLSPNRLKDFFLPEVKKASGGFVDKPLYNDARIGGMI